MALAEQTEGALEVVAAIVRLPQSPRCRGRQETVIVRYRVERVVRGKLPKGPLLVAHRCPRRGRGYSNRTRGDARRMRPGARHHLWLAPTRTRKRWIDPFDATVTRYRALRTNQAHARGETIVSIAGGAGANLRLSFQRPSITIGSASNADVRLPGRGIAPVAAQLAASDELVTLVPLGEGVRVNGVSLTGRKALTYRDSIVIGQYRLTVSFLEADWVKRRRRERDNRRRRRRRRAAELASAR